MAETPEGCYPKAQKAADAFKGTYLVSTLPFEVAKSTRTGFEVYDVSLPHEWHDFFGPEVMKKYLNHD